MFDTEVLVESHKQYMQSLRSEVKLARKERSIHERELEKSFKNLRSDLSDELTAKDPLKWLKAPMLAALVTCTCTLLVI